MADEKDQESGQEIVENDEIEQTEEKPVASPKKKKRRRKKEPVILPTDPVEEFLKEHGEKPLREQIALFARMHHTAPLLSCDIPYVSPSRNSRRILTHMYAKRSTAK